MTHRAGSIRADAAMPVGPSRRAARAMRAGLTALLAALLIAAAVLLVRRAAGALVEPLPTSILVSIGATLAAVAGLVRLGNRLLAREDRANAVPLLASLGVLAVAFAVSLAGSEWLGLTCLWGILLAEEGLAWRRLQPWSRWRLPTLPQRVRSPELATLEPTAPPSSRPQTLAGWTAYRWAVARVVASSLRLLGRWLSASLAPRPRNATHEAETTVRPGEEAFGADVVQQLTRRQLADGTDELAGWVRVSFAPGQRTENVHVAFCPSFVATPHLSIKQLAGPSARMKTVQLLPYGVRIDLKLSAPSEENDCVSLELLARSATTS